MDQVMLEALKKPGLHEEDIVKLVFQGMLGVGHLLADEAVVTARINGEIAHLAVFPEEPLTEAVSSDYVRLNLRPAAATGIRPEWIARLMMLSDPPRASREDAALTLERLCDEQVIRLDSTEWGARIRDQSWLPSHSESYRHAYSPAYRIISSRFVPVLQILIEAAQNSVQRERTLITIDGPCGTGKTTLARDLSLILQAPVVHTDDYVVPHGRKTPERLAQPGGNEDHERLAAEFAEPWALTGKAVTRRYLCMEDRLLDPETISGGAFAILQGSYSNMPDIRMHAGVRVYLTAGLEERLRRIALRDGEGALPMYRSRWIPLEDAYHAAFGLPDPGCIVIDSHLLVHGGV